jgi:hypothetical protein
MGQQPKTPEEIRKACIHEVNAVLDKYNCDLQVSFKPSAVLGQTVLIYEPTVVYKGERNTKDQKILWHHSEAQQLIAQLRQSKHF